MSFHLSVLSYNLCLDPSSVIICFRKKRLLWCATALTFVEPQVADVLAFATNCKWEVAVDYRNSNSCLFLGLVNSSSVVFQFV